MDSRRFLLPLLGTVLLRIATAQSSTAVEIRRIQDSAAVGQNTRPADVVAPGEFITIFGTGLSTAASMPALPNSSPGDLASYPTELAGTRVLFDGIPAQILYVSAAQINALVPYEISDTGSESTRLQVVTPQGQSEPVNLKIVQSNPAIFAIVGEDGRLNSETNGARQGSSVTILVSGAGKLAYCRDSSECPPLLPVNVIVSPGEFCTTFVRLPTYVGGTAGAPPGLLKVLVPLPSFRCNSGRGTVKVTVGAVVSPEFPISVF